MRRWLFPLLFAALALRLYLLLGPHREIDGDEAIVGLMALNIPRELPAFFWEQHYLGSLEAFAAAVVFALLGPSSWALKLVPALISVAFVGLVFETGRRAFGLGPAVVAATYVAIPPSFLGVWSVKARGGYAELLALGQLLILLCQMLAQARGPVPGRREILLAFGSGLVGGVALWTHPLALIYVLAGAIYLCLAFRDQARLGPLGSLAVWAAPGFVLGLLPAAIYNVAEGFPTLGYVAGEGTAPRSALVNLWGLLRYGAPVLVGLAEGTAAKTLLDVDWPTRPGSNPLVTLAALVIVGVVLWRFRLALALGPRDPCARAAAPFLMLILLVPVFVALSRFADLWAEPRYALPAYGATPLFAAAAWSLTRRSGPLFAAVVGAVFLLNAFSLATTDPRLALPTSAGDSTQANRAILIRFLDSRGLSRVYTDYWIGYPMAFESGERIVPAIRSGGFDRRDAYAHQVWIEPDPAFVFPRDALGDREFRQDLAAVGGTADVAEVSVYHVYTNVRPLEPLRP